MCGIAGVLARRLPPEQHLSTMLSSLGHRGPDGAGAWRAAIGDIGEVWLGHRRLAILDLSDAAAQPMHDTRGDMSLVFNGEIYNYIELRDELRAQGVVFRTTSDSEVLMEAYRFWGESFVAKLNGMFAFAIWDQRRNRLFAARDRYGEKPFLFAWSANQFSFASEFKALLLQPGLTTNLNDKALLRFGYDQSGEGDAETPFREIFQLVGGEQLSVEPGTSFAPKVTRWYHFTPRPYSARTPDAEVFAEFKHLLVDSVRLRMRSDVPVGSCLSGGLDSSAIVGIARALLGATADYHTFTGVFPGTYADEAAFASTVIESANTTAHFVEPTPERFIAEADQFIYHNELPVGSASQFAQWCVFAKAKEVGVTVLLDGQGADEALGGYEQYFALYVAALAEVGDTARLDRELSAIRARYPLALAPPGRSLRDRLPLGLRHFIANRVGKGSSYLYLLKPDVAYAVQGEVGYRSEAGRHALAAALRQDSFGRFLTTLLRYGDRNSMAHSREVRLPFCDHRIAEFALGLPPHLLMGEAQTKRLIREGLRDYLPDTIRARWNKQGFRPPQDLWFENRQFLEMVQDTLSAANSLITRYYEPGAIARLLQRVRNGELALGWTLWQPFMLALWHKHFVDHLTSTKRAAMNESSAA